MNNLRASTAVSFLWVLVTAPTGASAQAMDDHRLTAMAVDTVRKVLLPEVTLTESELALQAGFVVPGDPIARGAPIPPGLINALGSPPLVDRNAILECAPLDRRDCKMAAGRRMVVGLSPVERIEDGARVEVWAYYDYGSSRTPVAEARFRVHFHRQGGEWVLRRLEPLMRS